MGEFFYYFIQYVHRAQFFFKKIVYFKISLYITTLVFSPILPLIPFASHPSPPRPPHPLFPTGKGYHAESRKSDTLSWGSFKHLPSALRVSISTPRIGIGVQHSGSCTRDRSCSYF